MSPNFRATLLLGPLLGFLVLAYIVPFMGVIKWSVTLPEFGLGQYSSAVSDPLVQSVLLRTLRICAAVTVLSVSLAYVVTLIWVRGTPAQRLAVELCILIDRKSVV